MKNIILAQDAYKQSHPFMIAKSVDGLTSYIEARKGWLDKVVFFGLQAYIKEYLANPITKEMIDEAELYAKSALIPFNREMWEYVLEKHNGFMPIEIQALPEGTVTDHGIPLVQVTSNDRTYPGLISVIETSLLRAIWYPTSVASLSYAIKQNMKMYIDLTSDLSYDVALPVALNDFGARGTSSGESAAIGGLAHLVNFIGSDTLEAIPYAVKYYNHNLETDGPVLISVPATEHSVTTINGPEGESKFVFETVKHFHDKGFPFVSTVADSYDMDNFVSNIIGEDMKDYIINSGKTVVVRPDSGDPVEIVVRVLKLLEEKFGSTTNSKGFKVLPPCVRVIQGDGINYNSINDILFAIKEAGFSTENVIFGMGGQLLQGVMRDDHSFAMKTNAVIYKEDYEWKDVQKKPKTDSTKTSKAGRQAVVFYDGKYHAMREDAYLSILTNGTHGTQNFLEVVWDSGVNFRNHALKEIRDRANKG